jgi:hypothetical protein
MFDQEREGVLDVQLLRILVVEIKSHLIFVFFFAIFTFRMKTESEFVAFLDFWEVELENGRKLMISSFLESNPIQKVFDFPTDLAFKLDLEGKTI